MKVNEGHVGIMTLRDGTQISYATKRVTRNLSKLIFYTEKGIREIIGAGMTEEEKTKAEAMKKLDEKILVRQGYIAEMQLSDILSLS